MKAVNKQDIKEHNMDNKNQSPNPSLIPPHGGYRNLKSCRAAEQGMK